MKPTLQPRLGQSLSLTPQLRQAIKLLQMSSLEVEAEVALALESNPLLERLDERDPGDSGDIEVEYADDDAAKRDEPDDPRHEDAELDLPDWAHEHDTGPSGSSAREDDDGVEQPLTDTDQDIRDHLSWQLNLTPMSARDHSIALALIDAIDEGGYLAEPLTSLQETLRPEIDASLEEIEIVLHRIQHFDPLGVAARSLSECLLLQLSELGDGAEVVLARAIARDHLEALARSGAPAIAQRLLLPIEVVNDAAQLLRSLDPRPGAAYSHSSPEFIVPDAFAIHQLGRWSVRLGPGCRPRLGINHHYQSLIATAARDDAQYLRGHLQEARWLIKSLETRADTVLRVAECIVRQQGAFLDYGPEAMRPLVLREVAEELELHESTISRVTTRKYLHTPRGTFEFKHFFSSGVATVDGGAASSTAIQAMLRRLIDQENPRKPLSDAALVKALEREGVSAARRTVAKYREAMNIPSSTDRRRLC